MLREICEMGDFVRRMRAQFRFGDLSRSPMRLIRLEVRESLAECEWVARAADPWDAELPASIRERNVAKQVLKDAMQVRDLLFSIFPDVASANIRVYRNAEPPDLIIAGTIKRDEPTLKGIRSLMMRVKLSGLQFRLDDGRLEPLPREGPT